MRAQFVQVRNIICESSFDCNIYVVVLHAKFMRVNLVVRVLLFKGTKLKKLWLGCDKLRVTCYKCLKIMNSWGNRITLTNFVVHYFLPIFAVLEGVPTLLAIPFKHIACILATVYANIWYQSLSLNITSEHPYCCFIQAKGRSSISRS